MRTGIEILAAIAILANAGIYGTDVFGAIVLCPAIGAVDDRTLTQAMATSTASPTAASPRSVSAASSSPLRRPRSPPRQATG
jgi:hypothetical protein